MALRQLMISKKIEQRKASLAELQTQEESLNTRSAELESAIDEAKTDEEIAVVEGEIEKLDADKAEVEEKKTTLESEIAELEGELEQLNSKEPTNTPAAGEERKQQTGGETRMTVHAKRGFFKDMPYEQRAALVAREDVKDFLTHVRELGRTSQQRAVNGAELTIPDVMLELIKDNLYRYSKLIAKVRLRPIKGTSRQNIAGAIPEGIWTEACGVLNELSIVFNQIEIDGYKVGGFIAVCKATLEDSDLNLAAEILDAISQAIGLAVDKAILYGTGKKMPLGIATRLAQTSQPSDWDAKGPAWIDLHSSNVLKINATSMTPEQFFSDLLLKLGVAKPNYATGGTFWAMNRQTRMTLMSKAVTFNAAGAIVAGQMGTIPVEGGEIIELPFIPDGDIIGGYGSVYTLVERAGMQLAQSEHVQFIEDNTVFKGTARYDGRPIFGEAFAIVNINNVDPTTTIAFAPDNANPQDAYLATLTIGSLPLSPTFDGAVTSYTAATTAATNAITATAAKQGATVAIKNGSTDVASGGSATWANGENTVTITVKNGTTTRVYTVVVTKS